MDKFDEVMGSKRGSDRLEPGRVGDLQRWLNRHELDDYWDKHELRRIAGGWGFGVESIGPECVRAHLGLDRMTFTRGADGKWSVGPPS